MAMTRRNTRSYGKGFGDLNCPGDPGCPGYIDPAINQAIQNAIADAGGGVLPMETYIPAPAPSWVSAVSRYSMAIYAGAAVLIVLALAGGRR